MLTLGYERNWTAVCPGKQLFEALDRIVPEIEVIKIGIQNRTHILLQKKN
jgi:hypothetical protein